MRKINNSNIIAVTAIVLITTVLVAIPALEQQQQTHASIFKYSSNNVKILVKHVVSKVFNNELRSQ